MKLSSFRKRNWRFLVILVSGMLFFPAFFLMENYVAGQTANPALRLCINEVCTRNPGTDTEGYTSYEDYIELYNPTDQEISLENMYLSDTKKELHSGSSARGRNRTRRLLCAVRLRYCKIPGGGMLPIAAFPSLRGRIPVSLLL